MFVNRPDDRDIDVRPTILAIQDWIAAQVRSAHADGVVLGMSGGIDSSLVAALCAGALGSSKVAGMILNCSNPLTDIEDADTIARKFGIQTENINLVSAFDTLSDSIGGGLYDHRMARANLKSRLRMCALYARANECNSLVVGTTNLTEAIIGYYTKYGDGGVDIEPIMGLLKREVRMLAQAKGIPDYLVYKAPSAGLWDGQTDEEELGATYDQLDSVVMKMITGCSLTADDSSDFRILYGKVANMFCCTGHKRQIPSAAITAIRYR